MATSGLIQPSRLDFYQRGRASLLARSKKIDAVVIDTEGSDANLFVGSTSFMAHAVSRQSTAQFAEQTFKGSRGEALDRVVLDRTAGQVPRKGAAPAVVPLSLARSTFAAGAGSIAVGTKVLALNGAEYVTTTQADFAATGFSSTCEARAVQAGKDTQVGRNQIRRFKDPGSLFDPSITVNNYEPAAGGEPREDDDVYRERARGWFRALSKGTLAAIEFGARTVSGVASAQAQELYGQLLANGTVHTMGVAQAARMVSLYIADSSGVANSVLQRIVQVALLEWRGGGIQVAIFAGVPILVPIRLRLRFSSGVDTTVLAELIRSAVVEYVNSLRVGQALERGALAALLLRYQSSGLLSGQDTIVDPTGDVVPEAGRTLRTTSALVTLV